MKKILIFFLLLLTLTTCYAISKPYYTLDILDITTTPDTVYPGDLITVTASIENVSYDVIITNAKIELSFDTAKFTLIEGSEYLLIDQIRNNETASIVYQLEVKETVEVGKYNLPLKLTYENHLGDEIVENADNLITVSNYADLDIKNISISPKDASIGEEVKVTARLVNNGFSESRAVKVNIVPQTTSGNFENISPISETVLSLGNMKRGLSKNIEFNLQVNSDAELGTYSFKLVPSSLDLEADEEVFSITVANTQRVNIEKITTSPKIPILGEEFSVKTSIKNITGIERQGLKIELDTTPPTSTGATINRFTSASKSNIFISSLLANESKDVEFKLIAPEETEEGLYGFYLNVYEGVNQILSVPVTMEVKGKVDLFISSLDFSNDNPAVTGKKVQAGDSFSLSVQLENIGTTDAKAVSATIKVADEDFTGSKISYIGTIEPDDTGSAVFDMVANSGIEAGNRTFDVEFTYIDYQGQTQKFTRQVEFGIAEKPAESPVPMLILVVIILVILYFIAKAVMNYLALRSVEQ